MLQTKIKYWKSKGIELNTGVKDKDILALEKELSFTFPEDFKAFYRLLNGFKERDWTSNMFSLFPLERIKEEYEFERNEKNFVPICDWLISSHHLGFLKGKPGIFKDYSQTEKVCNNLIELLDLIDSDSQKIY
jgi:hypothetical protein